MTGQGRRARLLEEQMLAGCEHVVRQPPRDRRSGLRPRLRRRRLRRAARRRATRSRRARPPPRAPPAPGRLRPRRAARPISRAFRAWTMPIRRALRRRSHVAPLDSAEASMAASQSLAQPIEERAATALVAGATLADVAEYAGVSASTASRALNGRGELSAATRAAVIEAAERARVPALAARPLAAHAHDSHGRLRRPGRREPVLRRRAQGRAGRRSRSRATA